MSYSDKYINALLVHTIRMSD